MKLYKKFLFTMLLPFFSMSTLAMEQFNDGDYRISCITKNREIKFLQAHYKGEELEYKNKVRPEDNDLGAQSQVWTIRRVGNYYEIYNKTVDGRERMLDASDKLVRPQPKSDISEQKWFLRPIENGFYRILCNVNNNMKCLEAFPVGDSSVRTKREDVRHQDQIWKLERIPQRGNIGIVEKIYQFIHY